MHTIVGSPKRQAVGLIPSAMGDVAVMGSGPGWLAAEKPCGMSIHNDPGRDLCAVVQSGLRRGWVPNMQDPVKAVHAVHRLDRDTSGIVLLAVDAKRLSFFGEQFAAQDVGKCYFALIHGELDSQASEGSWMAWNWPLTASAGGRKNPMGKGKRVPCTTRWRIRERSLHYTLIECRPQTGRTHQIRRHAKLAGHPVVGDRRYGSTRSLAFLARHFNFHRLGLHAHSLTLRVPGQSQPVTICSGGLPQAMRRLLDADRSME